RIDARRARRLPGVVAVLTTAEAPELAASVPPLIREPGWPDYRHPVLASNRVRHVGEAVAVVVADDAYRAADAAEAVVVEYEPLAAAVRPAVPAIAEEAVRVVAPDVGGGFGIKGHVYPEDVLVPAIARRLGRPVKWVETRREHFLTASGDRDQQHRARLGLDHDGTIVALETVFTRDHGAYPTLGAAMTANTINHLVGPYRVPNYHARGDNLLTTKTFAGAYRGAGRPEAALVLDRLLDRAARRLGLDAAELRRRNLIRRDEMPFATGLTYRDGVAIAYDPADYVGAFDALIERIDWTGWRKEQAARRGT